MICGYLKIRFLTIAQPNHWPGVVGHFGSFLTTAYFNRQKAAAKGADVPAFVVWVPEDGDTQVVEAIDRLTNRLDA